MAKQIQLRRGTTAEHSSFTGVVGEVTIDTDKDVVVVHDGSTAGGHPMEKADADILRADTSDDLTAGFTSTSVSAGTKSSGTFTPSFADGNVQHYTNGGAHTLAPPSSGNGSLVLDMTNDGSAGAVTTSGFTKVTGDSLTTTNGNKFRFFITVGNGGSHLHKQALQ